MIITRTPCRISLFGGSTDYPQWFKKNGGLVVGGAINKYTYITTRYLPAFFDHKTKLSYSKIETVKSNHDIKHNGVRETLKRLGLEDARLEIHHLSDIPGNCGLGSSSSFLVGLIHSLMALQGILPTSSELAYDAITIEQGDMGECVGCQDQTFSAYGGFNYIEFCKNGEIVVNPIAMTPEWKEELESHIMIFFTGLSRVASSIASTYVPSINEKEKQQKAIHRLALDGLEAIYKEDIVSIGELLNKTWEKKRELSPYISHCLIDGWHQVALNNGAIGGKITGAGGGGCMLLIAPPEKHAQIEQALSLTRIDMKFDFQGSRLIFADKQ